MGQIVGLDPGAFRQTTCKNCANILRFRPIDIQTGRHTDISGCTDVFHYIVCPACTNNVSVRKS